jgi:hypothetical protein
MSKSSTAFYMSMSTVLSFDVDGIDMKSPDELKKIDRKVEAKVKEIVDKLKATHQQFADPDFGPNAGDVYGAKSLYGTEPPSPAGSKYPSPDSLRWDRPHYDDGKFLHTEDDTEEFNSDSDAEEDEFGEFGDFGDISSGDKGDGIWCQHGKLFIDGASSGDVVQGQLGDCWFISAMAVMGSQEDLLNQCFWRMDSYKEFGIFVCRFFKDCSVVYVIIDDRIPVKAKDGRPIFGHAKDPNELWVCFLEKAYAKLHGCYKALIGGFCHYGLGDMTGYSPRMIVLKPGYAGYSNTLDLAAAEFEKIGGKTLTDTEHKDNLKARKIDQIWDILIKYCEWDSLMGSSIQSDPKVTLTLI